MHSRLAPHRDCGDERNRGAVAAEGRAGHANPKACVFECLAQGIPPRCLIARVVNFIENDERGHTSERAVDVRRERQLLVSSYRAVHVACKHSRRVGKTRIERDSGACHRSCKL